MPGLVVALIVIAITGLLFVSYRMLSVIVALDKFQDEERDRLYSKDDHSDEDHSDEDQQDGSISG